MGRALQRRRRQNPAGAAWVRGRNRKLAVGLGVGALVAYLLPRFWEGAPDLEGRIVSGPKVGNNAPDGLPLKVSPTLLASQAGVNVDVLTLARAMASEAGTGPAAEKVAVAWVVRNHARELGKSITEVATAGGSKVGAVGYYGAQNLGGRYVSTRFAPRQGDIDLAQQIMNGEIPDNTGGAVNFIHPGSQDISIGKVAGYTKTAADFIANRKKEGKEPRTVPGAPRILVFVKTGKGLVS